MAIKLTSRQHAQLEYLQTLPPKFQRMHAVIEEMTALRADEVVVRGFARQLDELKANAAALSITGTRRHRRAHVLPWLAGAAVFR